MRILYSGCLRYSEQNGEIFLCKKSPDSQSGLTYSNISSDSGPGYLRTRSPNSPGANTSSVWRSVMNGREKEVSCWMLYSVKSCKRSGRRET